MTEKDDIFARPFGIRARYECESWVHYIRVCLGNIVDSRNISIVNLFLWTISVKIRGTNTKKAIQSLTATRLSFL